MATKGKRGHGTYKVERLFRGDHPRRVIKRGLTKEQAMAHCKDPETASNTCTKAAGLRETRLHGPWFDSWKEE